MRKAELGNITLYNADCMDLLREMPDKSFDLAIVDPPYGDAKIGGGGKALEQVRTEIRSIQTNHATSGLSRVDSRDTNGNYPPYPSVGQEELGRRSTPKKLLAGTWPPAKNTSKNFSGSRSIR